MKRKISQLQLTFLIANLILSSSVISLPQVLVQLGEQNVWLVPIVDFVILLLIILILFRKKEASIENLFSIGRKHNILEKFFIGIFIVMVVFALLRDLRATVDFIAAVLLPSTPLDVLVVLAVLAVVYVTMSGLEVVLRVNNIYFVFLALIVLALPLLLINEINLQNLQPLPGLHNVVDISRGVFISFPWMGEIVFSFVILSYVNPSKDVRKAILAGTGLGILLFFITLTTAIAVVGTKLISEEVYPIFVLIQQINLTDFLDRLDLVIVIIWVPIMFTKFAFLLYCIHHSFSFLRKDETVHLILPISFVIGLISILIFNNNMDLLSFSMFSWASFGLLLEILLFLLFFIVKKTRKSQEKK